MTTLAPYSSRQYRPTYVDPGRGTFGDPDVMNRLRGGGGWNPRTNYTTEMPTQYNSGPQRGFLPGEMDMNPWRPRFPDVYPMPSPPSFPPRRQPMPPWMSPRFPPRRQRMPPGYRNPSVSYTHLTLPTKRIV